MARECALKVAYQWAPNSTLMSLLPIGHRHLKKLASFKTLRNPQSSKCTGMFQLNSHPSLIFSGKESICCAESGPTFFMFLADAMARAIVGAWPLNMLMPETPTWQGRLSHSMMVRPAGEELRETEKPQTSW